MAAAEAVRRLAVSAEALLKKRERLHTFPAMPALTTTAAEAFAANYDNRFKVRDEATAFVCPYPDCRTYAQHHWGVMLDIRQRTTNADYGSRVLEGAELHASKCEACGRDVLFLDKKMIKPATSEAPAPTEDMPAAILGEYNEAAAILPGSPRGAAALLRLAVQKLLPILGATKRDINDQIGESVGAGKLPPRIAGALDTLRVIGNEAVHPGTIDLTDDVDTAMNLFRLLNFIIEKAISEPKHADEMFATIPPGKLEGIARRNERAIEGAASKPQP